MKRSKRKVAALLSLCMTVGQVQPALAGVTTAQPQTDGVETMENLGGG